ncbi:galactokinase [Leucothrix sargassi]|nr:galactokinase [Leucothrix sargassi]
MSRDIYRLDSANSTLLLLSIERAIPTVIYYGSRLNSQICTDMAETLSMDAIPNAMLDSRVHISLLPENSRGFFGEAGLQGHRSGSHFAHRFNVTDVQSDFDQLVFTANDDAAGLVLTTTISCDRESNVFTWQHALSNTADSDYIVDYLSCPTIPQSLAMDQLITLHGRWGKEFQQQTTSLAAGRFQINNRRGRTSHEYFPGLFLGQNNTNELSGNAFAAHLGWSGNYRMMIESLSECERYFQCGELLLPGEIILAKGDSYTTPTLYTTTSDHGFSTLSQQLHQFARSHILPSWTQSPRPVHANSWEAMYFDLDTDKLKALVDAAHATGAERFVLDDGWFMGRRSDNAGLGDWQVDPAVFPDGLGPLVEHVRSKGMQFGLWFEPEMVNPDSALFREHPEWVLQHPPYPLVPGRNQEVLDLSQPELFDYLFDAISQLVEKHQIDYIKWDMNRDTLNAGSGLHASQHKQVKAVYALMNKLNETHPTLEIESCASGGGRADFGVLQHTGRVWTSDNIDPIERIHIQRGFSLFFPPEIMGSHIGSDTAHLTGRQTSLDTRAIVALQGQTGFEFDSRLLDDAQREVVQYYTNIYKDNRDWISNAKLWRLPSLQNCLHIQGLVSDDQANTLWTVASDGSHLHASAGRLKLHGLTLDANYTVTCLNNNLAELAGFARALPEWLNTNKLTLTGELLMQVGLPLPYLPPQFALLLNCQKIAVRSMNNSPLLQPFIERFSESDQEIREFYAPGRVNLIGDHTDHCGGLVFPCAIDRGTRMLIRRRSDNIVKLASMNFELMASLAPDELDQKYGDNWINYVLGVISQFRQNSVETTGFECLFSGDIPNGGGLSSSASLEVVTAFALNQVFNGGFSDVQLVKMALAAENDFVGVNCGIMDQYAIAMAQKDHAMMLDCNTLECEQTPLKLDGYTIVIVNSNQRRDLVDSKYNERFEECQTATREIKQKLDVQQLAEVSMEQLQQNLDVFSGENIAKRAQHVVSEHNRVREAVDALNKNDLETLGRLMIESHQSMSNDFQASTDIIDKLIEISLDTDGVIGARMTGGGFGGCTVTLVEDDKVEHFVESVGNRYREECGLTADFYPTKSDNGMREITA